MSVNNANNCCVQIAIEICQTIDGRDKILRLIQNILQLLMSRGNFKQWQQVARQISTARTLMRFFDSFPFAIRYFFFVQFQKLDL